MDEPMCRTCLAETNTSIFKTINLNDDKLSLVEMLKDCTGITVTESDQISLNICDNCTEEIIKCYIYRKKCWNSHNFLMQHQEENAIKVDHIKFETLSDSKVVYEEERLFTDIEDIEDEPNESVSAETILDVTIKTISKSNVHEQSNNVNTAKYVCHHCGQKLKNQRSLTEHVRRHTGEKPYKCELCDYRAVQRTSISSHMRTHTGERPYECEVCGKLFRTASGRASHRHSHSKEKPYECIVCSKKFKQKDFKDHMLIHDPDKYVPCKFCGKKFARKDNLKTHMKQHTGERPHVCELCGKGFIQKHCWRNHMVNHHNQ